METPLNIYQARVRAHQTDLNAAMYHGAYFDVFDDARIEVFRRLGYTYQRMQEGGWIAVIRHVEADFYAPARMDDLLTITVTIPTMRRATMTICYEARRNDELVAAETAVFAFVGANGKPLPVPSDLRAVVEEQAELLMPGPA